MHGAQRLDDPEAHAAPAMHGNPCGFIDHDQVAVLVNDRGSDEVAKRLGRRLRGPVGPGLRGLQRRQPDAITGHQAVSGLRPPAVDPHLARSQDPVNQAARHRAQRSQQEIVETLAVIALLRLDIAHWADWQMRVTY